MLVPCFLEAGFSEVPACMFYAYLHYHGQSNQWPKDTNGTGGGRSPKAVVGPSFDLTKIEGWGLATPRVPAPEPEEPDFRITLNLGLLGPTYDDVSFSEGIFCVQSSCHIAAPVPCSSLTPGAFPPHR